MSFRLWKFFVACACCIVISANLCADEPVVLDTVILANGAKIEGKVSEAEIDGKKYVLVETVDGDRMKVLRSQCSLPKSQKSKLMKYEVQKNKSPDTAEGHWAMAEWCAKNLEAGGGGGSGNLSQQREYHLQKLIRLEPNHTAARSLLGYRNKDGNWVHRDHFPAQHGMVRIGTRWYTPQELQIERMKEKSEGNYDRLKSEIRKRRNRTHNMQDYVAFLASLQGREGKFAVPALIAQFKKEKSADLKMLALEAIGRQDSAKARSFLVDQAILSDVGPIRDRALSLMNNQQFSKSHAASRAEQHLASKDPLIINRAGYVLGELRQERSVLPLIKSVVTKHDRIVGGENPGQVGANFNNGGMGGLQMGSKKQKITFRSKNKHVISALTGITGQNFDGDQVAWYQWYKQKYEVSKTDMRRDD